MYYMSSRQRSEHCETKSFIDTAAYKTVMLLEVLHVKTCRRDELVFIWCCSEHFDAVLLVVA